MKIMTRAISFSLTLLAAAYLTAMFAFGAPATEFWNVDGPDDTVAVAAARLSGWYATADSYENNVEIRDIRGHLKRRITAGEISALLPWMSLGGGPDGPSGLAFTDSGRWLFILVHDDTNPGDGYGSDAVLRYDTFTDLLSVFSRLDLFDQGDTWPMLAAAHHKGRLYVGTFSNGVRVYNADKTGGSSNALETAVLPDGGPVHGLAVDARGGFLYASSTSALYRADVTSSPLSFTLVGSVTNVQAITYAEQYGNLATNGLYLLKTDPIEIQYVPESQARGLAGFAPTVYFASDASYFDIAATPCGRLLTGSGENAVLVSDDADSRLGFGPWLTNELIQVVTFATNLISPDGEPDGWVIDADVQQGWTRFHPASPDAAMWTILATILREKCLGDVTAQKTCSRILTRYAGMALDGIKPELSADGIPLHWYDPNTGTNKSGGWIVEYATMSAMELALGAARARTTYPTNTAIATAACKILCQTKNWTTYFQSASDAMYLRALNYGGPDLTSLEPPFHEGLLFAAEAAAYAGGGAGLYDRWLDRARWPTAEFVSGYPVTGNVSNQFQSAFVSLYPYLLLPEFRNQPSWQIHIRNLLLSYAAWNDENAPNFFTVFSAGTTDPSWSSSGYHADSLGDHPGDVTTFPALLAFCTSGDTAPAVAAYNAYRKGARQTFASGASILYRRSDTVPTYQPNSAGQPDVVMGAIGLAELISPGIADRVLAVSLPPAVIITNALVQTSNITANFCGLCSNAQFTVQSKTNLLAREWTTESGWPGTSTVFTAAGNSQQFIRVTVSGN